MLYIFNINFLKNYFPIFFLKISGVLLLSLNISLSNAQNPSLEDNSYDSLFVKWNYTLDENKHALALSCPKIDTVRIALIGLGNR